MSAEESVDAASGATASPQATSCNRVETLHRGLELVAENRPEAVALRRGDKVYTFATLDGLANTVARELATQSFKRGALAAVWSSDPARQMILSFGAWKAGMTAVILEVLDPRDRLRWIMEHAGVTVVVTDDGAAARDALNDSAPMVFEVQPREISSSVPETVSDPDMPAVIVFTSGSEGQPKGVIKTHGNMVSEFRRWVRLIGLDSSDRVALLHPLNFSAGLKDAVVALLSGATLCSYDTRSEGLAPFYDWIVKEKVTVLPAPVAFFRHFLIHAAESGRQTTCNCILLGGDRLYRRDIENARRVFGRECRLIYIYAATEVGIISRNIIEYDTRVTEPIPVGIAEEEKEVRILGENGKEMPPGEIGEIAIVAADLPPGYWKDPEGTSRKYRPSLEEDDRRMYLTGDHGRIEQDGMLYLYGRNDRQVKIRGYRMNIGEIEGCLNDIDKVVQAVVTTSENNAGDSRLIAYITLSGDPASRPLMLKTLRKAASKVLPAYMVPDEFVVLDVIPTTNRGKIDRRALAELRHGGAPFEGGETITDTEREVIDVWESVLDMKGITVTDDLMDLGVSSLSGMELCVVLGERFSIQVPYAQLTVSPTVRELAAFIDAARQEKKDA